MDKWQIETAVMWARMIARENSKLLHKHGAILFNKGIAISEGYNSNKTDQRLRKYGYKWLQIHAEAHAILRANPRLLNRAVMIVVRDGKTKLKNSKPCSCCMAMIKEVGIKKVIYSNIKGELSEVIL